MNVGDEQPVPWLCLLTADASEGIRSSSVQIASLQNAPAGCFGPLGDITAAAADDPSSNCAVIDLPVDLFERIVPRWGDLPYLAHAGKADGGDTPPPQRGADGWYACLVGNRFPRMDELAGKSLENSVYLVSLEGYRDYLTRERTIDRALYTHVRMVCLATWRFACKGTKYNLTDLFQRLDVGQANPNETAALRLQGVPETGNATIDRAIRLGFFPVNHVTRNGDHTVSWYRGPLVPTRVDRAERGLLRCADEGLKYDPTVGFFDVSLSAAWQMGRLLALQSASVAEAIHNWRVGNLRRAASRFQDAIVRKRLEKDVVRLEEPKGGIQHRAFSRLALTWLKRRLRGAVERQASAARPLLGELADPTGLVEAVGRVRGLLTASQVEELCQSRTDRLNAVMQMASGTNSSRSGKR